MWYPVGYPRTCFSDGSLTLKIAVSLVISVLLSIVSETGLSGPLRTTGFSSTGSGFNSTMVSTGSLSDLGRFLEQQLDALPMRERVARRGTGFSAFFLIK